MDKSRRFLRVWLASLLTLAVAVVGLNLIVDPYEVFGTPRIAGLSVLKPAAKNHSMLAKTYQVARAHPQTVVIGSSPIYLGIDAFDSAWPEAMRPVYNYGIPGGYATSTSLRTLQEALTTGALKNAVVFLDFQNFFTPEPAANGPTEDDRRFRLLPDGRANPDHATQTAADMFLSLATMGALLDSLTTVAGQRTPGLLDLGPDGSSTEADFINAARTDGMHDLFAQKDAFEAERATRLAHTMAGWQGPLPNMDIIAAIIALTRTHPIKLTLALAPHHADALELYWRNGLWPRMEQLKTALAAVQGGNVTVWDFIDYSPFSTEAVPPDGDRRTQTSWFWEPTHFKKPLGHVMIQRMFGQAAPAFGVRLTPDNVAERNAAVRAQRQGLVCGGSAAFPADDCPRVERVAKQHDPT